VLIARVVALSMPLSSFRALHPAPPIPALVILGAFPHAVAPLGQTGQSRRACSTISSSASTRIPFLLDSAFCVCGKPNGYWIRRFFRWAEGITLPAFKNVSLAILTIRPND
jgi:hypothetical protein